MKYDKKIFKGLFVLTIGIIAFYPLSSYAESKCEGSESACSALERMADLAGEESIWTFIGSSEEFQEKVESLNGEVTQVLSQSTLLLQHLGMDQTQKSDGLTLTPEERESLISLSESIGATLSVFDTWASKPAEERRPEINTLIETNQATIDELRASRDSIDLILASSVEGTDGQSVEPVVDSGLPRPEEGYAFYFLSGTTPLDDSFDKNLIALAEEIKAEFEKTKEKVTLNVKAFGDSGSTQGNLNAANARLYEFEKQLTELLGDKSMFKTFPIKFKERHLNKFFSFVKESDPEGKKGLRRLEVSIKK